MIDTVHKLEIFVISVILIGDIFSFAVGYWLGRKDGR